MKELRIAFTGGGTGGHIYPILAVAQEVKRQLDQANTGPYRLYYFGSPGQYAQEFVKLNIKIVSIIPFKFRSYFSVENIIDIFKFPFALIQAVIKMLLVMPDALFSKGGTGAPVVILAAALYRIPIFLHESDSIPGRGNRMAFPFAKRVAVSFQKTTEVFSGDKVALVGNPVRSSLFEPGSDLTPEKAKRILEFDPALPLILALGGSQGSTRINEFLLENAKELVSKYQILHQVGTANFADFRNELAIATEHFIPAERSRYKIVDFIIDMKEALLAADLIISRAGSGAIFEIAASGKPSILIPLSDSASDHQRTNAYEYEKTGACVVIEEENLKPALFFSQLSSLLTHKDQAQTMSANAKAFAKPQAAQNIAQELIALANR